ncbi:hypothetical protein [Halostella litorea]|uniref:hypothetical protein n=1 Tax=Halostella litorea TaxID=2528831 RepID=UPI001092EE9B|nr:hypothetical protein [Halostella litorea]
MVDAEALSLGLVPPLAALLLAVSVPVPPWVRLPAAAALLLAGAAGGYVAGTLAGGDRRRRALHGLASGGTAGVLFGGSLAYAIHESAAPRHTVYWWLHYAVATNTPPDVVVAYGYYVLAGVGVAAALAYAAGGAVAAGATMTEGDRGFRYS